MVIRIKTPDRHSAYWGYACAGWDYTVYSKHRAWAYLLAWFHPLVHLLRAML
jgi:hypothetical protein